MIRKCLIFIFSSVILVCLCVILAIKGEGSVPEVSLSVPSGFYPEGLFLEMEGVNGDIYYTLDGTRPDTDSYRYEGGFFVGDASENENVYSLRDDLSVSFLDETIHEREAGSPEDYVIPDKKVDKCTVVRAVCVDRLGGRSEEALGVYFVGFDKKSGYDGVYILSLSADEEDLFDYDDGIYVTGRKTSEYLEGGERALNDDFWWWWPANYRMKGKDWERPAHLEIFDDLGRQLVKKDIGIRIQGGGSRAYLPRSLNLIASREYDGTEDFGTDIFSTGFAPDVLTLFSGGDSRITKLEDYLPASLCAGRSFETMRFIPAVMFLNGEYWGFYFLTERFDENYFMGHYGVPGNDVVMIKEGEVSIGRQDDLKLYEEDMAFLKNVDVTREENLEAVNSRIDLDSYLDYYAVQLYIDRRNDWPYMNVAAWKCRETGDGRWRWILFDDNSGAYGSTSVSSDSIENTRAVDPVFDNLMKSPILYDDLRERMLSLSENEFEPGRVRDFVEEYRTLVTPVMKNEFDRFYGTKRDYEKSLQVRLDRFEDFFTLRKEYICLPPEGEGGAPAPDEGNTGKE